MTTPDPFEVLRRQLLDAVADAPAPLWTPGSPPPTIVMDQSSWDRIRDQVPTVDELDHVGTPFSLLSGSPIVVMPDPPSPRPPSVETVRRRRWPVAVASAAALVLLVALIVRRRRKAVVR